MQRIYFVLKLKMLTVRLGQTELMQRRRFGDSQLQHSAQFAALSGSHFGILMLTQFGVHVVLAQVPRDCTTALQQHILFLLKAQCIKLLFITIK